MDYLFASRCVSLLKIAALFLFGYAIATSETIEISSEDFTSDFQFTSRNSDVSFVEMRTKLQPADRKDNPSSGKYFARYPEQDDT